MRVLLVVVLLAGCSGAGPVTGPEAPLAHGEPEVQAPGDAFDLHDDGTMVNGIDRSWEFEVLANATSIAVQMAAIPIEGVMHLNELTAEARRDGQLMDGTTTGVRGSFGGASPYLLVDIAERGRDGNMTAYDGNWTLVLEGTHQVADFAIRVRVEYAAGSTGPTA